MTATGQLCDATCLGHDGSRVHATTNDGTLLICADPEHRQRTEDAVGPVHWQHIPDGMAVRVIDTGAPGRYLMTFANSGDAEHTRRIYANRARRAPVPTWDGGDAA